MKKLRTTFFLCFFSTVLLAQTFDMTLQQPQYSDAIGYGYDVMTAPPKESQKPFFFSVKVPDGNYHVTVTLGSSKRKAQTVVRAESRRLLLEQTTTDKGKFKTYTFVVNKRSPIIDGNTNVVLKPREKDYLDWDNRLTFEFNGPTPAVKTIDIRPDTTAGRPSQGALGKLGSDDSAMVRCINCH